MKFQNKRKDGSRDTLAIETEGGKVEMDALAVVIDDIKKSWR